MNLLARYNDALRNMPSPGGGCHAAILGIANMGVLSGLVPETIFQDIRRTIPSGKRKVSDEALTPVRFYYNGRSQEETKRLREIVQRMLREADHVES